MARAAEIDIFHGESVTGVHIVLHEARAEKSLSPSLVLNRPLDSRGHTENETEAANREATAQQRALTVERR